jgi:hypothetical protein
MWTAVMAWLQCVCRNVVPCTQLANHAYLVARRVARLADRSCGWWDGLSSCVPRRALEVDLFSKNIMADYRHFKELESWGTTKFVFNNFLFGPPEYSPWPTPARATPRVRVAPDTHTHTHTHTHRRTHTHTHNTHTHTRKWKWASRAARAQGTKARNTARRRTMRHTHNDNDDDTTMTRREM